MMKKEETKFLEGVVGILITIAILAMFFSCKKEVETTPQPTIIGEWETISHLVYLPDSIVESDVVYDWLFRDNGYVLYVNDNQDTSYYVYEIENDSLFFYNNSGGLREYYSLDLSTNDMVWEDLLDYNPITDFSTRRVITFQRK